jgi:hypothetical protein
MTVDLKEEARTFWRNIFGKGYRLVARDYGMNTL